MPTKETKNKSLFGSLVTAAIPPSPTNNDKEPATEDAKTGDDLRKRQVGYLDERENRLAQLATGAIVDKTLFWVDPAECRIWEHHNRRYDLLNQSRCQDLIDSFKAQGHQEFPAVVRRISDDPTHRYEVIAGARRHWTVTWLRANNYSEFRFLIEVRELTDEEAFRLSDLENRDRKDISDYERALDYQLALDLYYENQKAMATRLEVSEAWLTNYLALARLQEEIVDAFPDVTAIRIQHSRDLKPLLKDEKKRPRVLDKASEIGELQDKARQDGGVLLSARDVMRELKRAGEAVTLPKRVLALYESSVGRPMLTVRRVRDGLELRIAQGSGASKDEIREQCIQAVNQFVEE